MSISAEQIKKLREETGISVMQCKEALTEAQGDSEKAIELLRKRGSSIAAKKADRELGSGTVASYVHNTKDIGVLITLLCETDFVAKNEEFVVLARDIAMHIAASNPVVVSSEDDPDVASEAVLLD